MMLQDNVGDWPRKFHIFENIVAGLGMRPDQHDFDITKLAGFGEDFGGYVDFA